MVADKPKILDAIATLKPISSSRLAITGLDCKLSSELPTGLVGKIVSIYDNGSDAYYLVGFVKFRGYENVMAALGRDEFVVLQFEVNN